MLNSHVNSVRNTPGKTSSTRTMLLLEIRKSSIDYKLCVQP